VVDGRENPKERHVNKLRRSYEARVLVVPLDERGVWLLRDMSSAGLEGVMTMAVEPRGGYVASPLATESWTTTGQTSSLAVVGEADMVVLLVGDLAMVDVELCRRVAHESHRSGTLIAALVVGTPEAQDPAVNQSMAVLRKSVDMLVAVRSLRLATPFIDVLRGGAREPVPAAELADA
jgi:hypothetical protein